MSKDFADLDKQTLRPLYALAMMYFQYCNKPFGHDFMSAGERAIDVLEDYGLASEETGVDTEKLDELRAML